MALEQQENRMDKLTVGIVNAIKGSSVTYDRSSVLKDGYADVTAEASGRVTLTIPSLSEIRGNFEQNLPEDFHGTCREIAQYLSVKLVKEGLVDEANVYGCADAKSGEAHYVVVAKVDGEECVIDVGYSQPVPMAVPVNGEKVESDFYSAEKGSGQIYGGKVSYQSQKDEDGSVGLVIADEMGTEIKNFTFFPMTEELDKQIVTQWLAATGKAYRTGLNERGQVDRSPVDTSLAEKSKTLAALHGVASTTRSNIDVVYRGQ